MDNKEIASVIIMTDNVEDVAFANDKEFLEVWRQLRAFGGRDTCGESCVAVSFDLKDGSALRIGLSDEDIAEHPNKIWIQHIKVPNLINH